MPNTKATSVKKKSSATSKKVTEKKTSTLKPAVLKLLKNDPGLAEYADAINGRHQSMLARKLHLTGPSGNLSEFADGYLYFGLHRMSDGWVLREWAPNATEIFVVGDFNKWKESPKYAMKRVGNNGNWEIKIKDKAF